MSCCSASACFTCARGGCVLAPLLARAVPCSVWAGWDPQGNRGHSSAQTTEHQELHSPAGSLCRGEGSPFPAPHYRAAARMVAKGP